MTASFRYKLDEARRTQRWPVRPLFDKIEVYKIFDACGVSHPKVLAVGIPLEALKPDMLLEPVVVKPVAGHSSRGVVAVVPEPGGKWRNLVNDSVFDFAELQLHLRSALEQYKFQDRWVVEELLLTDKGTLPRDVKVYSFRGTIGFTLIRTPTEPRAFRFYGPDFTPVNVGKDWYKIDKSLPPPFEESVSAALEVSAALPLPFVRVDLYETARGIVFGELTPYPGNYEYFNSEWDRRLGELYEQAETELLADPMVLARFAAPSVRRLFGLLEKVDH